jgi:hypothetical protein
MHASDESNQSETRARKTSGVVPSLYSQLRDEVIAAIFDRHRLMQRESSIAVHRRIVREIAVLISQATLDAGADNSRRMLGDIWQACSALPWPYEGVLRVLAGLQPDALAAERAVAGDPLSSRSLPELAGATAVLRTIAVELARDASSLTHEDAARRYALASTSHTVANWIAPRAVSPPIPLNEHGLVDELDDFDRVWGLRRLQGSLRSTYTTWRAAQASALTRRHQEARASLATRPGRAP